MNFHHEVVRSYATLREMLTDRGADVSSMDALSGEDVVALSASRNVFSFDLPSCQTRVIYELNAKFKPADVRKHLEAEEGQPRPGAYIVVSHEQPSNAALKGIHELGLDVQLFQLRELQFNISQHEAVPQHEPIREDAEIERISQRYGLRSPFQMPLILATDPMARYLALKHGQLVRIKRVCPTAGEYIMYRCCTNTRA